LRPVRVLKGRKPPATPDAPDIIREAIDGRQAMQLMAEAEGWADQLARWMKGEA
jgi:hypothetical protein